MKLPKTDDSLDITPPEGDFTNVIEDITPPPEKDFTGVIDNTVNELPRNSAIESINPQLQSLFYAHTREKVRQELTACIYRDTTRERNNLPIKSIDEAFDTSVNSLITNLAKRFPEGKYPFHNLNHSVSVATRALYLANLISEASGIGLTEKDYMAIVLESLAHDLRQDSDIEDITTNNEALIKEIENGETPALPNVKQKITRALRDNEINSIVDLQKVLEEIEITGEGASKISLFESLQNQWEHIGKGIEATIPYFEMEDIVIDGSLKRGLNITQPELENIIKRLRDDPKNLIGLVLPLADLPTSLGKVESETESLSGGYAEFRELYPNIGLVAKIMNMGLEEDKLEAIITEEVAKDVIEQVLNWTQSQIIIVAWQGENMGLANNKIGEQLGSNVESQLTNSVHEYGNNMRHTIDVAKKLHEEIENEHDPYKKLRIALSYAEYSGFDTKMDGLPSEV